MKQRWFLMWFSLVGMLGCEATHLVYVQNANLGVDVSVNPTQNGTAKIVIGYDREVGAIVPRIKKSKDDHGKQVEPDAMTLASVNKVSVKGLEVVSFRNFVATGKAAEKIATNPDAVRDIRKVVYTEPAKKEAK